MLRTAPTSPPTSKAATGAAAAAAASSASQTRATSTTATSSRQRVNMSLPFVQAPHSYVSSGTDPATKKKIAALQTLPLLAKALLEKIQANSHNSQTIVTFEVNLFSSDKVIVGEQKFAISADCCSTTLTGDTKLAVSINKVDGGVLLVFSDGCGGLPPLQLCVYESNGQNQVGFYEKNFFTTNPTMNNMLHGKATIKGTLNGRGYSEDPITYQLQGQFRQEVLVQGSDVTVSLTKYPIRTGFTVQYLSGDIKTALQLRGTIQLTQNLIIACGTRGNFKLRSDGMVEVDSLDVAVRGKDGIPHHVFGIVDGKFQLNAGIMVRKNKFISLANSAVQGVSPQQNTPNGVSLFVMQPATKDEFVLFDDDVEEHQDTTGVGDTSRASTVTKDGFGIATFSNRLILYGFWDNNVLQKGVVAAPNGAFYNFDTETRMAVGYTATGQFIAAYRFKDGEIDEWGKVANLPKEINEALSQSVAGHASKSVTSSNAGQRRHVANNDEQHNEDVSMAVFSG